MKINFQHNQSAHCENGVTSNLLKFHGIELSEPMIFGIGAGFFFSHMPFIKLNGMAVTSFRVWPGVIFRRVTRGLHIRVWRGKFRNPDKAMEELDRLLEKGIPVGMLVGVFHLPYFPREYRFHFNAHNITVFGKEGDSYLVSDPVMEHVERLTGDELKRVRYAQGTHPPKGRMYYIKSVPDNPDIRPALIKGIRKTAKDMTTIPLPMFGAKGILYLAGRMRKWTDWYGLKGAALNLSQVIRMLEEIGTGGAGFRFIYAAFLQESAEILGQPWLNEASLEMTGIGDAWREFAYEAGRFFKNRNTGTISFNSLADKLMKIADREEKLFRQLRSVRL